MAPSLPKSSSPFLFNPRFPTPLTPGSHKATLFRPYPFFAFTSLTPFQCPFGPIPGSAFPRFPVPVFQPFGPAYLATSNPVPTTSRRKAAPSWAWSGAFRPFPSVPWSNRMPADVKNFRTRPT